MRSVYLHIGMPRTGTSFLQQKVFPNLPGIDFYGLDTAYYSEPFNKMQYADDTLYNPEEFQKACDDLKGEKVLLSNEWLVGQSVYFNYVNRSQIARRLSAAMPNASVILFIRGQAEVLKSLYSIALHGWEQRTPDEFIWNGQNYQARQHQTSDGAAPAYFNTAGGHEHLDGYLYQPLIELYRNLFPKVEVFLYEDLLNDPQRVVDRLENIFDAALPVEAKASILKRERMHQGVGASQAKRLRKLNKYYGLAQNGKSKKRVFNYSKRRILNSAKSESLSFSTETKQMLKEFYSAPNQVLAQTFPELKLERYKEEYFL